MFAFRLRAFRARTALPLLALLAAAPLRAQPGPEPGTLHGTVTDAATGTPLAGATVFWPEAGTGTVTDTAGAFRTERPPKARSLRFSMVGYSTKTFTIHQPGRMDVALAADERVLEEAVVEASRQSASMLEPVNLVTIGTDELQRAACCNLSESFETTADVDVSYTDAVSGAKQIRMLGLDGRYVQLLTEGRPGVRGLALPFGLTYIPGTWMSAIQVTKGPGSVVNGYEALSGQVNVEYHKPQDIDPLSLNAYGNIAGRLEFNAHGGGKVGGKAATASYFHGHWTGRENDRNGDGFLDIPIGLMSAAQHRWQFQGPGPWRGQLGAEGVLQRLDGGQVGAAAESDPRALYDYALRAKRARVYGKLAKISERHPGRSVGSMWQATWHEHTTRHGDRYALDARQRSAYANVIHDHPFPNPAHALRVGGSLVVDEFTSELTRRPEDPDPERTVTQRTEIVPGAFAEYTYERNEWSVVTGLRLDHHNLTDAGFFATPRLHLRKCWNLRTTWRLSGGSGFRTVNPVVEFSPWLNSARDFRYPANGTLLTERSYGAGTGLVQLFTAFGREGQLRVDAHATWFTDRVVADLDADPGAVTVRQATGPARSYAAQAEVEHEILTGLDLRLAAKYEDVRVRTAGQLRRETFVPVWRGLAGLAWTSGNERWTANATLQLTGPSRLPLAYATERSEAFPLLLGQVSHKVGAWRVYVGTENALNYRQPDPIRGAEDPFGPAFDAAGVWGPILGRNVYAGVTVTLPR